MMNATNSTLTKSESALIGYVQTLNLGTELQARNEGWTFWTLIPEDIEFFRSIGVSSVNEYNTWRDEVDAQEAEKEERKNSYGW